MTTQQIADRLVSLCKNGDYATAQTELYADNATSTELHESPAFEKVTTGKHKIFEKGEKFRSMIETLHATDVSAPLVTDRFIVMKLMLDATMKGRPREKMEELCLYEVKDGKIVAEQFFM
ncbi:MAG: nuclear transport factor 2 family protein [Chitinophagaceae bacterium]